MPNINWCHIFADCWNAFVLSLFQYQFLLKFIDCIGSSSSRIKSNFLIWLPSFSIVLCSISSAKGRFLCSQSKDWNRQQSVVIHRQIAEKTREKKKASANRDWNIVIDILNSVHGLWWFQWWNRIDRFLVKSISINIHQFAFTSRWNMCTTLIKWHSWKIEIECD